MATDQVRGFPEHLQIFFLLARVSPSVTKMRCANVRTCASVNLGRCSVDQLKISMSVFALKIFYAYPEIDSLCCMQRSLQDQLGAPVPLVIDGLGSTTI